MTLSEGKQRLRNWLIRRQQAYQQVFNPESVMVQRVLSDLAKFCRATDSTFHDDPRIHAALEGRREVWLRITKHLDTRTEDFLKTYDKEF